MEAFIPTPDEIAAARHKAGLTVVQCAALVHVTRGAWHKWENGDRPMPTGMWELFVLKTRDDYQATLS